MSKTDESIRKVDKTTRARKPSKRPNGFDRAIAAVLKKYREDKDIPLSILPGRLGVTRQQIYRYENGLDRINLGKFMGWCMALDISAATVLKRAIKELRKKKEATS